MTTPFITRKRPKTAVLARFHPEPAPRLPSGEIDYATIASYIGEDLSAIFGSNIIFSSGHLYISVGLSVTAFLAGLFWGWLYSRQRRLAGVAVSHMLLGFFAFEVVGLGVLA